MELNSNKLLAISIGVLGVGVISLSAVLYVFITKDKADSANVNASGVTQVTVSAELKPGKSSEPPEKTKFDEMVLSQRPSIKMMQASPSEFVGKTVSFYGYAHLGSFYNAAYGDAASTHYSINLKDPDFDGLNLYFEKGRFKDLFEYLSMPIPSFPFIYENIVGKYAPVQIECTILPDKFDSSMSQCYAEGLGWKPYKP